MPPKKRPMMDRLWAKVKTGGEDECWPWQGATSQGGYGVIGDAYRKLVQTHRAVFEDANGPLPPGVIVRHTCDNPPCCNPKHLLPGTYKDNTADCRSRGRHTHGEKHPVAKLTDGMVKAIRADTRKQVEIAKTYNMTQGNISAIRRRRIWTHIP